ncbi:MAG: MmgE/PrpD family protein, partial [Deltaproteobacteria bacterium]|nr:MmgE/PrpD family protein [Deltaproteobacteria bacterium]
STARKIILKTDDELDKLFWDDRSLIPCRVTIETKDGRRFEETVLKPKGSPESPLTEAEIEEKFISLTEPVIGIQKARRIMEKVKRLETVDDSSLLFAIDD